jgi:3'-phosphoadenosine 5'-phosphosulfate sulfotransferase (PAPS reductase)/FAD synthetase
MTRTIHCFFSGGRDSALACYIAKRVADARKWRFVLVHIDTTISIRQTREYVRQYAEWLGTELVVLRPERTFKEYATEYGFWPMLLMPQYRWCYRELKLKPTIEYLRKCYKDGDLVVLGVRKSESRFRDKFYVATFFERNYDSIKARVWAPLLFVDEPTLVKLIEKFNIPRSPVWKYGFSGECLCLAGASLHTLAILLKHFPEERSMLLETDDAINNKQGRRRPSAPYAVWRAGYKTLREFYEQTVRAQLTLDDFLPYTGKACQGSCML